MVGKFGVKAWIRNFVQVKFGVEMIKKFFPKNYLTFMTIAEI